MSQPISVLAGRPLAVDPNGWYERLSAWEGYDIFMRLPAVIYFSLVLDHQFHGVAKAFFAIYDGAPGAPGMMTLSARFAAISVTIVFIALTVLREKPVKRAMGLRPRLAAFLGATFLFASAFLPYAEPSVFWDSASALLSAVGAVLTTIVVLRLGRSFSTMAEARSLVTSGIYGWVRHPLYLVEEIIIIGGFLQYRSAASAAIVVLHFIFQLERMRCEEEVLTEAFPEYEDYRRTTARLVPGVY